jgi:hypothetical protein
VLVVNDRVIWTKRILEEIDRMFAASK